MKIIKPMQQGILNRTFVKEKKFYLSIASLSYFPFSNPEALGTEQEMWGTISSSLDKEMIFDLCMPKVKSEVLMSGKCFAPDHTPIKKVFVDLDFGPIRKRIVVSGNRFWRRTEVSKNIFDRLAGYDWEMSDPEPFLEMDIGWRNAFGREDFQANPLGKGYLSLEEEPALDHSSPLPNVERPERMISSPNSVSEPAGYGPIDMTWPQRAKKVGKAYDKEWVKERFPEPALDMDPTYYNAAPEEQQLDGGFWRGNERFVVTHMHSDHPELQGSLPGIRPRCFVLQRFRGRERWDEVSLHPETVWLFPNIERGILISRGIYEIGTYYGVDVDTLLLAWELKEGIGRSSETYRESVALREEEETAEEWMAREDDLSPVEGVPDEPDMFGDANNDADEKAALVAKRLEDDANSFLGRAGDTLKRAGLDPAKYLSGLSVSVPPPPKAPKLKKMSDIGKVLEWLKGEVSGADAQIAELESKSAFGKVTSQSQAKEIVEKKAKDICNRAGMSFDDLKKGGQTAAKDSKSSINKYKDLIKKAKESSGGNPEVEKQLDDAAQKIDIASSQLEAADSDPETADMIRANAHMMEPSEMPDAEKKVYLRQWVIDQYEKGGSLASENLTGVDLSGLNLKNADFKGATLDSADLSEADLEHADLSEATLARARFNNARLAQADLSKSGLGKAIFSNADLSNVNFSGSAIHLTDFNSAIMKNSIIKVELCREANFASVNLDSADLSTSQFMKSSFEKASFRSSKVKNVTFVECKLIQSDFSGADLEETSFVEVDAEKAVFTDANMLNANVHLESRFVDCGFMRVNAVGANFSETNFVGTDFRDAIISDAAFGESSLNFARFDRAVAREADFTDADLTDAVFRKADLMLSSLQGTIMIRTNFEYAHLFAADMLNAKMEDPVFRGAIVKRTILEEE